MDTTKKITVLIVMWALVFMPVYPELFKTWLSHSNSSHGLLVPLICGFLVWNKYPDLKFDQTSHSTIGLIVLIASLILYLLSLLGGIVFVMRLMMVSSLIGLILFVFGTSIFKQLAFPLFFLFFMVPVPDSVISVVSFPLQLFATKISASLIQLFSIPVLREGNMLYFVQTELEVAEACSGIRSITALMLLSVLFVYVMDSRWLPKTIMLVSAIPIAILANIFRVSSTGVLAHFYGDSVARGFLHDFSGMVVFVFGMCVLFVEYRFLNWIQLKS